jgi:hypothetical protein
MTDHDRFERTIERRITTHVAPAARPFDAGAVAREAMHAGAPSRLARWSRRRPEGGGHLRLGGLILFTGLIAGGAIVALPASQGPSPAPEQRIGKVVTTGSMTRTFSASAGVELADGRVLVAGEDRSSGTGVAEVWDPTSGTWTDAGSPLGSFPGGVSLVALPDGRAILMRGPDPLLHGSGDLADPGIWDPATLALMPIPPPERSRGWRPVIALHDGRVLGVAEVSETEVRSVAWDPASGSFDDLGRLDVRASYATGLADGRILLAGLVGAGAIRVALVDKTGHPSDERPLRDLARAQVGDSAPGYRASFQPVHLADDRVAFLSEGTNGVNDPVDVWDPAAEAFAEVRFGDHHPYATGAAGLPDSRVLLTGASYLGDTLWIWDPATGNTTPAPASVAARTSSRWSAGVVVPLRDGRILLADGGDNTGPTDDAFIYVP